MGAVVTDCVGVPVDQARAEVHVIAGLTAVVDQRVDAGAIQVVGRGLQHIDADLRADAVVGFRQRRRGLFNPLDDIFGSQSPDVAARHLHHQQIDADDLAGDAPAIGSRRQRVPRPG